MIVLLPISTYILYFLQMIMLLQGKWTENGLVAFEAIHFHRIEDILIIERKINLFIMNETSSGTPTGRHSPNWMLLTAHGNSDLEECSSSLAAQFGSTLFWRPSSTMACLSHAKKRTNVLRWSEWLCWELIPSRALVHSMTTRREHGSKFCHLISKNYVFFIETKTSMARFRPIRSWLVI